jgi:superfamily I DNA/RNA helicase
MHRLKGLEFNYVIIAGVNDKLVPLEKALSNVHQRIEKEELITREKSLLYVAVTRAKKVW